MNKGVIIGIIVAIIAVAGGVFALTKKSDDKTGTSTPAASSTNTESQSTPSQANSTSGSSSNDQNSSTTITYTNSGFSPATLTVKAGTTVTIKNSSSNPLQFNSDPHPEHTDNTELNVGEVSEGGSQTFTVTKTGTWGYHNHLNPSDTGTIVVQ